ncbi:MAG: PPOX class F420-dependent oxidoreductase [bacterium]
MSNAIPMSHQDLFDKKCIAYLACRLAGGSLLVNPVWCALVGGRVVINSAEGRLKDKAMRRDGRVTLCITDPDNPFRYLEIRGRVEEVTTEDAEKTIDRMAERYLGVKVYPNRTPGMVRVNYWIAPQKVVAFPIQKS